MKIDFKKGNNCKSTVSISATEENYKEAVNIKLKDYFATAKIKGYRKGKDPISLIEKLYGEQINLEEAENICIDKLDEYLHANRILCLGDLIKTGLKKEGTTLTFEYDLHVLDYFDLDFLKDITLVRYTTTSVSDKEIENQIFDIQSENCNTVDVDKVGQKSNVTGTIEFNNTAYEFVISMHNADSKTQEQLLIR